MIKNFNQPATKGLLDEEALIEEARERARRRRRFRFKMVVVLIVAACLIGVGVVHDTSSPTRTSGGTGDPSAKALTCPSARVKLLGVSAISGGLGHAGLNVRASVSTSSACTMHGYPIISEELTSHSYRLNLGSIRTVVWGCITPGSSRIESGEIHQNLIWTR